MKKKSLRNKGELLRKGSRRVEAWIYSVINPLIEALRIERSFLEVRNWTWRYQTNSLEFILPLERYLDSASLPNFDDFLRLHPQIKRKRIKHEDLRAALSENCLTAFNYLVTLQTFQEKVKSSFSAYERENPTLGYPGGAVPKDDFGKLIAQYVVNQIKELPDHYTTSKFWSRFGDGFLEFRTGIVFEKLDASGQLLENEDERLAKALEDLRSDLVETYDIPAAPVFHNGWARQQT